MTPSGSRAVQRGSDILSLRSQDSFGRRPRDCRPPGPLATLATFTQAWSRLPGWRNLHRPPSGRLLVTFTLLNHHRSALPVTERHGTWGRQDRRPQFLSSSLGVCRKPRRVCWQAFRKKSSIRPDPWESPGVASLLTIPGMEVSLARFPVALQNELPDTLNSATASFPHYSYLPSSDPKF